MSNAHNVNNHYFNRQLESIQTAQTLAKAEHFTKFTVTILNLVKSRTCRQKYFL